MAFLIKDDSTLVPVAKLAQQHRISVEAMLRRVIRFYLNCHSRPFDDQQPPASGEPEGDPE